jgi:hypothetical protein
MIQVPRSRKGSRRKTAPRTLGIGIEIGIEIPRASLAEPR